MNDYQIECFLSAAELLNFTKVSIKLHASQPTISRQISSLEEELGFALFEREKGALMLTPGGAIMARELRNIRSLLQSAIVQAARATQNPEGKLSIGYIAGLNTDDFVYPPVLAFQELYGDVEIRVETATFSELRKRLDNGAYDIVFTYSFELANLKSSVYEKCYPIRTMIAMSANHPLARQENFSMSDLTGQTFLLLDPAESPGREEELLSVCSALNIGNVCVKYVANIESMLFGILSGNGVSLVSSGMECNRDPRFCCIELPRAGARTFIAAAWKMSNLNPLVPLFIETIRGFLRNGPPDEE